MGSRDEYFISLDIESDGPCAGLNSMLQLGAAFYTVEGDYLEGHCWNLLPLPDAHSNPDTMKWWDQQDRTIWNRMMTDRQSPETAMWEFHNLVMSYNKQLRARPVAVCYPSGFDFSAVLYYLHRFTGQCCLGISCIDINTMSMVLLNLGYRDHGKKDMPKRWFDGAPPHSHNALEDCIGQFFLFRNMREDVRRLHSPPAQDGGDTESLRALCNPANRK